MTLTLTSAPTEIQAFEGTVAVVGLGYIGLPTAVALATRGVQVIGIDVSEAVVSAVSRGEVPFVEPDLAVATRGAVSMGRLTATTTMPHADAYVVAVPTPFGPDHTADLSYVRSAVEAIAPMLVGGELVILESTSPPGTSHQMSEWLAQRRPDLNFPHTGDGFPDVNIAHCPERVLPGRIMIEMVTNDRVVGGLTPTCAERAAALYRLFCQGQIHVTDAASAEMAKLVENAFRDVNIAFANELSLICEQLKLDVWEVIAMANRHPRVNILNPGPGVGGHCIAVDPWFIVGAAPESSRLIRTAREVNDGKPHAVVRNIVRAARKFREPTIAVLGLAFKANIDDLRESPAVEILQLVAAELPEARLLVAEPFISALPPTFAALPHVQLASINEAIEESDIVALLVDHDHFRAVNRSRLAGRIVFDTRGIWR